ncbi:hypothetical protein MHUMG1_04515 [Metarhizium humberi]|uniref:Peptidase M43 pregnancy-associated plasma-A domain-containing protein n=1 Tax=Metarhizium humberi TaxID=2596975 RepID=A0A9P8S974_9HYPO|nr:hypothetical protein MHUMG1_04515 [Metarhizium humberi]
MKDSANIRGSQEPVGDSAVILSRSRIPAPKSRSPLFYYVHCTCPLSHEFHQAATGVDDTTHAEYAYLLTSEAMGDIACLYRQRDRPLGRLGAHLHNERGINGTQPSRLSEYKLLRHRSRLVSEQCKDSAVTMLYPFSLYFTLAGTAFACAVSGTTTSDAPRRTPSDELTTPQYGDGSCDTQGMINIETYITLFANNETHEGGWLGDDIVEKQIKALNEGFSGCRIGFTLKGLQRSIDAMPLGFDPEEKLAFGFYGKYRKGSYKSLNLYYSPNQTGGVCTHPGMRGALHIGTAFNVDGCQMGTNTMPGGTPPYEMGKTTVHEVGHWLGLLHTFQGGCNEVKGDFVSDTPAVNETVGRVEGTCPRGQNSCPGLPDLDPIHNYMSYSSE